jgi:hypothetical protein
VVNTSHECISPDATVIFSTACVSKRMHTLWPMAHSAQAGSMVVAAASRRRWRKLKTPLGWASCADMVSRHPHPHPFDVNRCYSEKTSLN